MTAERALLVVRAADRERVCGLLALDPASVSAPVSGEAGVITHYAASVSVTPGVARALERRFAARYSGTWWGRRGPGGVAVAHAFDASCPRRGWTLEEALSWLGLRRVASEPATTTTE